MSAKAMSMEEFLEHTGSDYGGGSVMQWREEGHVDVLLHPSAPFYSVWSHGWFSIYKDRETGKDKIGFTRFNSYEDEKAVLKKQRFRGGDNEFEVQYPWNLDPIAYYGSRKFQPRICPFSLLLEWVREQIDHTQAISWTDRIFDIDTKEGDENSVVLHAGGFTGLFSSRDLTDEEKVILKKAGIHRNESFKEEGKARMQYVMCVVPYAKPGDGPIVAIEAEALGKKFKKHITDLRDDKRDPRTQPVVFRWKYDEDKEFSDKYDVAVRVNDPISDECKAALATEYPADKLERIIADSNLVALRNSFEMWWCHKVIPPWDLIFKPSMEFYKGKANALPPVERGAEEPNSDDEDDSDEGEGEKVEGGATGGASVPASTEDPDDGLVECSHCHKGMGETEMVCPHCGATYDAAGVMTPPAPPAPKRTRSSAAAAPSRRGAAKS